MGKVVVDLAHPFSAEIPRWPYFDKPEIVGAHSMAKGCVLTQRITCIKMFVCDQSPRLDIDFENDSLSSVSISRHLMCVTSTSAIELILHNVTWCITVCTCMHCTCNRHTIFYSGG